MTGKSILLVIAHPDDEVLFFGPFLAQSMGRLDLHVLCLTTGNSEGLGWARKRELERSLAKFKIPTCNYAIIDDQLALPDGIISRWDLDRAAQIIHDHITKWNIQVLVSFDREGVSYHPNHIATYCATVKAAHSTRTPFFKLKTVSILRKYAGILPVLMCGRRNTITISPFDYFDKLIPAMQQHRSQFVWFRKLYVIFSSYMYTISLTDCD